MEFELKPRTHYLIVSGSHSYGIVTPTSDFDLRGWCVPPKEYFLSFDKKFEQNDQKFSFKDYPFADRILDYSKRTGNRIPPENEEIDHCVYDIRKFFNLTSQCNPNLIENLYVEDDEVLICDKFGKMVRDNRDLFLSAKAKFTFTGYAYSQLKRINLHRKWIMKGAVEKPSRKDFGLPETSVIPAEQRGAAEALITRQVREWLLQEDSELSTTQLNLLHDRLSTLIANILSSKHQILEFEDVNAFIYAVRIAAMKKLGMDKNYMVVIQAEKKYHDKLVEHQHYRDWVKNRNPVRAELEKKFQMDTKHAMQLARLLVTGKELLLTGKVRVKRTDDIEMLKSIRNGGWSYEKVLEFLNESEKELNDIYNNKKYVVPHHPDIKALSSLCFDIVSEVNFGAK